MSRTAKRSKKRMKQPTKYVSRRRSRHSCRAKLLKPPCSRITRPRFKQGASSRTKLPGAIHCFTEHTYVGAETSSSMYSLPAQDTSSLSMYTYGIVNRGKHPALVQIQISPNALDYAVDSQEVIAGGRPKHWCHCDSCIIPGLQSNPLNRINRPGSMFTFRRSVCRKGV
ncbi:DUF6385 domain-containing protein [Paenibacillus amylolyticus]|nr:DUF6385 domain-containing protein [Paenibacillus amylolyticus]WFR63981.1 DUF6385 domain-containing protein [Paenibacillus amylolyticus]